MTPATPKNFDENVYWEEVYCGLSQYIKPIPEKVKVLFERYKNEIKNLPRKERGIFYHQNPSEVARTIYDAPLR